MKAEVIRDVYQSVMQFNQNRDARFLPTKYKLMASSAFRFFRGSCHLFYQDLVQNQTWEDKTQIWICGDLHLENFGSYKSDHDVIYFDLNDFDEAVLAHPSWDVSRFICSIFLEGKELNLAESFVQNSIELVLTAYIEALQAGKAYAVEKESIDGIIKKYIKAVSERDPIEFLNSKSVLSGKNQRTLFIDNKKFFALEDQALRQDLINNFQNCLNAANKQQVDKQQVDKQQVDKQQVDKQQIDKYQVLDVAIRVAGTGSIGLNRYVFLLFDQILQDYSFFDVKQAQPSSLTLTPYLQNLQPKWQNQAERIQTIQNYMQYIVPAHLSSFSFHNEMYIVKQLQPEQDKIAFKDYIDKPHKIVEAWQSMARLIASAQIRSAGRKGSDNIDALIRFATQSENWKALLQEYAYNYAQQVLQDYDHFCQAYAQQ